MKKKRHFGKIVSFIVNTRSPQLSFIPTSQSLMFFGMHFSIEDFINCAYARYEKGLEIDEIWGDKVETKTLESEHSNPTPLPLTDSPHAAGNTNDMTTSDDEVSIEMTFERENSLDNSISGSSMTGRANTETFIEQGSHTGSSNEYEIVDGVVGDLDDDDLDDLEAEIARELGED